MEPDAQPIYFDRLPDGTVKITMGSFEVSMAANEALTFATGLAHMAMAAGADRAKVEREFHDRLEVLEVDPMDLNA